MKQKMLGVSRAFAVTGSLNSGASTQPIKVTENLRRFRPHHPVLRTGNLEEILA